MDKEVIAGRRDSVDIDLNCKPVLSIWRDAEGKTHARASKELAVNDYAPLAWYLQKLATLLMQEQERMASESKMVGFPNLKSEGAD